MYYVMSDIHGEYEKYLQMLDKIRFSQADTLFVLGDAVDRGPQPVRLLQDMAARDNVQLIKGNHEGMASYVLHRLNVEITEENAQTQLDETLMEWQLSGGNVTMKAFRALSGKAEIIHANHNILIDCGAAYGGRLACLCLDTMEETYV